LLSLFSARTFTISAYLPKPLPKPETAKGISFIRVGLCRYLLTTAFVKKKGGGEEEEIWEIDNRQKET
jgi:hypothetical protein